MPQTIDPTVKALASTIGELETGAPSVAAYSKKGASGEFGRYQFMPDTYKNYAQKYLGDANAQPTVENQNKIAYSFVADKKAAGYNPAQIMSMWNAGEGKPDAYKQGWKGTNSQGVAYDTPAYVQKGSQIYQQKKAQLGIAGGMVAGANMPAQGQTQGQNPSFVDDVSKTVTDAGTGVSNALNDSLTGKINPLSGLIQGAGAVAGGVGGLLNNVLEHAPVVGSAYKGLESGIGQVAQAAANTDIGKGLVTNYQNFSQAHPELAGDIGGAINIASAVPMFKGLGLLKSGVTDAAETALKGTATKAAEDELASNIGVRASKGLVKAQARGVQPLKVLVDNKQYLPSVVRSGDKFVYDASKGGAALDASLNTDENTLQTMLKQGVKKNIGVDLDQVRAQTLKDIAKEYSMSGNYKPAIKAVNDYFDSFGESTGGRKIIDLNELNGMKRDVRNSVFGVDGDVRGTASADIKYQIGQSLMKQVEQTAKKAGVDGVGALNKQMSGKIEALKVLQAINGKVVKGGGGATREIMKDVAGGAGEMMGNSMGVPLAGTFAGRGLAGLVGRRLPKTALTKLTQAVPLKTSITRGASKLAQGLGSQALVRQQGTQ